MLYFCLATLLKSSIYGGLMRYQRLFCFCQIIAISGQSSPSVLKHLIALSKTPNKCKKIEQDIEKITLTKAQYLEHHILTRNNKTIIFK
ncbi:hypothetical protein [uncultured Gammaproteobacteria bacterium]|nr:hypothetical protein [uncultured Gammaproteobacteria bacterium]